MIKNILKVILLFFIFLSSKTYAQFDVKAKTAILQDYLSGEILYEKNSDLAIFTSCSDCSNCNLAIIKSGFF